MFELVRGYNDMRYPTQFGQNIMVNSLARVSQTSVIRKHLSAGVITQLGVKEHCYSTDKQELNTKFNNIELE